jgi:hypothetical protein
MTGECEAGLCPRHNNHGENPQLSANVNAKPRPSHYPAAAVPKPLWFNRLKIIQKV